MKNFLTVLTSLSTFYAAMGMKGMDWNDPSYFPTGRVLLCPEETIEETEKDNIENFVQYTIPVHHYNKKVEFCFLGETISCRGDYWNLYESYEDVYIKNGTPAPEAKLLINDGKRWCFKYPKSNEGLPAEWLKFYKDSSAI